VLHTLLLHSHSILRWVILGAALFTIFRAVRGLGGAVAFADARRASVIFTAALHTQLLLGLALFFTSPFIGEAMKQMKATMADPATRFFVAEHPVMMVAAVVLATFGGIFAKGGVDDAARHRRLLVFTSVTLLLLVAGIPWGRPLY
jgi:uncharacterized membrane protein